MAGKELILDGNHSVDRIFISCASAHCFQTSTGNTDYSLEVSDATNSDIRLSASSKLSSTLAPSNARLGASDTNSAWTPDDDDDSKRTICSFDYHDGCYDNGIIDVWCQDLYKPFTNATLICKNIGSR